MKYNQVASKKSKQQTGGYTLKQKIKISLPSTIPPTLITALALSPSGRILAVGDSSGALRLINVVESVDDGGNNFTKIGKGRVTNAVGSQGCSLDFISFSKADDVLVCGTRSHSIGCVGGTYSVSETGGLEDFRGFEFLGGEGGESDNGVEISLNIFKINKYFYH